MRGSLLKCGTRQQLGARLTSRPKEISSVIDILDISAEEMSSSLWESSSGDHNLFLPVQQLR